MLYRLLKNRWSFLVVVAATLVAFLAASKPAQAHHYTSRPDGNGCVWTHQNDGRWLGACIKPYDANSGWIWSYDSYRGGWERAGHYNTKFMHLYAGAFTGLQYELASNRSTGKIWFKVGGGIWTDTPPTGTTTTTIGPSPGINLITHAAQSALSEIWLRPNCTASYNGC